MTVLRKKSHACYGGLNKHEPLEEGVELLLKSNQDSEALTQGLSVTAIPVRCLYSVRHFPDSREETCQGGDAGSPVVTHHHDMNVPNMTDFISDTLPNTGQVSIIPDVC